MHSHAVTEATPADATALLRDAGLRVAKPRTAVIGALAVGYAPCLTRQNTAGFVVHEGEVTYCRPGRGPFAV